jgi:hypothetical protein
MYDPNRDSVFVEWYAYDRYFSLVDTAGEFIIYILISW